MIYYVIADYKTTSLYDYPYIKITSDKAEAIKQGRAIKKELKARKYKRVSVRLYEAVNMWACRSYVKTI